MKKAFFSESECKSTTYISLVQIIVVAYAPLVSQSNRDV